MQSKPILGALSRKLDKNGLLSELPIYRMKGSDFVPHLGATGFTPAYFHLKKDDEGNVSEI